MRRVLIGVLAITMTGCGGPVVDLAQALQIVDFSSGWYDVGVVDGKNKIVPTATFKLRNTSDQTLTVLQVNALFRRIDDPVEWGSAFKSITGSEGLAPGATSEPIVVNSQQGYTGTEPRLDMLKNAQFVDAKVDLFAKYSAVQWKRIGEHTIDRQLLMR
jgi:hypothetical protein